jgi:undecaprenyl-diphosphatase
MTVTALGRGFAARLQRTALAVHRGLQLTWRGYIGLLGACVGLALSLLLFAGLGEDVVSHNGQYQHDPARLSWFIAHRDLLDIDTAKLLAIGGSVGVLLVLAGVTALVLIWRRVPLALAVTPLLALLTAGTLSGLVKGLVGRARPGASLQLAAESGASFPSGHATDTTAFLLAGSLVVAIAVLRRPLARIASVVSAGLVGAAMGASRLVLGVHWPTDVLAGVTLGAAVALAMVVAAVIFTRLTPPGRARRTVALARVLRWSRADAAVRVAP